MSLLPHASPAGWPADLPGAGSLPGQGDDTLCDRLAADWVTIWQSELAGLAADRESAEHLHSALVAWMIAASALRPHEPADRREPPGRGNPDGNPVGRDAAGGRSARPDASAGAAPAAAASDAGETIARLERRVAELERRLAAG